MIKEILTVVTLLSSIGYAANFALEGSPNVKFKPLEVAGSPNVKFKSLEVAGSPNVKFNH
uniref:hypothetical protein n=1 Tax=Shewanella putrefaciens TaxID=24 RepID=UPI000FFB7632|nr:hypothetical protein [Shewanella putrefaciens]